MFQLLTCLLLLSWRDETHQTHAVITRSKRQEQRFQNFPAVAPTQQQQQFHTDRFQTSFSSDFIQQQQQQRQFAPQPRQQQQQFSQPQQQFSQPPQQQQQSGLSVPGSGRSLFDQIVNRINTGHRENARRKKIQNHQVQ